MKKILSEKDLKRVGFKNGDVVQMKEFKEKDLDGQYLPRKSIDFKVMNVNNDGVDIRALDFTNKIYLVSPADLKPSPNQSFR